MDIYITKIDEEASEADIIRVIASVLHDEGFLPKRPGERKINFKIVLHKSGLGGMRNNSTGTLTIPIPSVGKKFLGWVYDTPIVQANGKKLKFKEDFRHPPKHVVLTLDKTPFIDPDKEAEHLRKKEALDDKFRVTTVQFGLFYRSEYPTNPEGLAKNRKFSIEWEKHYVAWMNFEYDHKLLRLDLGEQTQTNENITLSISIRFSNIQGIATGFDGQPYIAFDLLTPPILEEVDAHRSITGDIGTDSKRYKHRITSLHPSHIPVAPYAPHLRILLYNDHACDIVDKFYNMCLTAGLSSKTIVLFKHPYILEATKQEFYSGRKFHALRKELKAFPWPVAFQLESFLCNGLLHAQDVSYLLPEVRKLCKLHPKAEAIYVAELLRRYHEALQLRPGSESPQRCLQKVRSKFVFRESLSSPGNFLCCHVTFTPTRMLLEGPYATQSNRIIRQYKDFPHQFLRVDFRDEDRLAYRWEKQVDGRSFLESRVGGILKGGFEIAGRPFEFLAYSSSALREHAVWFISPFQHPTKGLVCSEYIRKSIGNFAGTKLIKCPSKYAARIGQAFTATDPSVEVERSEWEEVEDLTTREERDNDEKVKKPSSVFTDGVGTISKSLGDQIWSKLCETRRDHGEKAIKPSAYQIRFLGFKGVVAVDEELDKHPQGIRMRLRESMNKFEVDEVGPASIEIAQAFEQPIPCYLNRPLIMLLEDLGVRKESFQELQDATVAEARTIDLSLEKFQGVLNSHSLGTSFSVPTLLRYIQDLGLELHTTGRNGPGIDNPFFKLLRWVARSDVLRDIKHSARILVPSSYLLVGVADEGPAYMRDGYENVYHLPQGSIYACIQKRGDIEPTWLQGACTISRSPVVHPGDVQKVYAIGKPPDGMLCLFRSLRNVVVLPSVGERSLASMLAGGDVDGDLFSVMQYPDLHPSSIEEAAEYPAGQLVELDDRESNVHDICNFIVEYINSDVLGLLSDRLLVIADQSKYGMRDKDCMKLAELCSQAVDYPKLGKAVDLIENPLPRTLIRCKPDWHAAEVILKDDPDYYESDRALGCLSRSLKLDDDPPIPDLLTKITPLTDPISMALRGRVENIINAVQPTEDLLTIEKIYQAYCDELRYICATHTLSNKPADRLLESEVVIGTILATCSQKRLRKARTYQVRLHAKSLVEDVQREFLESYDGASHDDLVEGLRNAWRAWYFSQTKGNEFGAGSFGLVALRVVFDCLDKL